MKNNSFSWRKYIRPFLVAVGIYYIYLFLSEYYFLHSTYSGCYIYMNTTIGDLLMMFARLGKLQCSLVSALYDLTIPLSFLYTSSNLFLGIGWLYWLVQTSIYTAVCITAYKVYIFIWKKCSKQKKRKE